jgi:hypothetical protein
MTLKPSKVGVTNKADALNGKKTSSASIAGDVANEQPRQPGPEQLGQMSSTPGAEARVIHAAPRRRQGEPTDRCFHARVR